MAKRETPLEIQVTLPKENVPAPEAANWFSLANVNTEIQLTVGYVDIREMHDIVVAAREGKKLPQLIPTVTHRIFMSTAGFMFLRSQVEELTQKMRAAGSLPNEPKSEGSNA